MQLEDIVFVECVVGYDVEEQFVKPLSPTHEVLVLYCVNPTDQGYPL